MDKITSEGIGANVNGFSRDFVAFLTARSDQLNKRDIALKSEDYRGSCYALDSVLDKVKDKIGEETFLKLDEAINDIVNGTIYQSYKAGFSDGVKMIVHSLGD